jgi:hypothetical protein
MHRKERWLRQRLCTQSTAGVALAAILGVQCIRMDRLYWRPGWAESTREEFETE